jgi:hypothetical protein
MTARGQHLRQVNRFWFDLFEDAKIPTVLLSRVHPLPFSRRGVPLGFLLCGVVTRPYGPISTEAVRIVVSVQPKQNEGDAGMLSAVVSRVQAEYFQVMVRHERPSVNGLDLLGKHARSLECRQCPISLRVSFWLSYKRSQLRTRTRIILSYPKVSDGSFEQVVLLLVAPFRIALQGSRLLLHAFLCLLDFFSTLPLVVRNLLC